MEGAVAFGTLRRCGFGALRRRALDASPTALERLFIATPLGSGSIVAGPRLRPEVACSRRSSG
jgi:hypothetical protein